MADGAWAVAGAAVGGIVTYASARLQGASEKRRLEAENRRLAQDRSERERQHRQETYQQFLASLDALRLLATGVGHAPATQDSWGEWVSGFGYLLDGIRLFGGDQVVAAAGRFEASIVRLNAELSNELRQGKDYADGLFAALSAVDEELNAARRQVIEAMRSDVALAAA